MGASSPRYSASKQSGVMRQSVGGAAGGAYSSLKASTNSNGSAGPGGGEQKKSYEVVGGAEVRTGTTGKWLWWLSWSVAGCGDVGTAFAGAGSSRGS